MEHLLIPCQVCGADNSRSAICCENKDCQSPLRPPSTTQCIQLPSDCTVNVKEELVWELYVLATRLLHIAHRLKASGDGQ